MKKIISVLLLLSIFILPSCNNSSKKEFTVYGHLEPETRISYHENIRDALDKYKDAIFTVSLDPESELYDPVWADISQAVLNPKEFLLSLSNDFSSDIKIYEVIYMHNNDLRSYDPKWETQSIYFVTNVGDFLYARQTYAGEFLIPMEAYYEKRELLNYDVKYSYGSPPELRLHWYFKEYLIVDYGNIKE